MPRFAAVALSRLRVEIARARRPPGTDPAAVLAVVLARPGGAVKDETSLLGNTRLDEVSAEAHALGIHPGQTIASARARSSELAVRVVPQDAVTRALEGVAEAAMAFGPTVAFEAAGPAGDVAWVDVTGCAHLSGGEGALAAALADKVAAMGYACRVAIADGPRVAAAVARGSSRPKVVVPPGQNAAAIAALPLAALGLEEGPRAWLSSLGLRRGRDLQKLPRASLGVRLGKDAPRAMALLEGIDREPLTAYVPPVAPSERASLEYGIESAEALVFVAKRLADRLAARLEGRCLKASRLDLELKLDRFGVEQGVSSSPCSSSSRIVSLSVVLAAPLVKAGELLAVLKTRIEAHERQEPFTAPILEVTLRASEMVAARAQPLDLLAPEAKADRALPKLASELSAELGHEAVGTLALADTWVMKERSRLVPFGVTRRQGEAWAPSRFLSGGAEPTRFLSRPFPVKRASLLHARLVARLESIEWWRGGLSGRGKGIEHYIAWVDPMAWVAIDRSSEAAEVLGWMD